MADDVVIPDLEAKVRRANKALNRRDFDGILAVYAPDAIGDASPLGLGEFEGHEAIRAFFEDWTKAFEDFEEEIEEFHDLGNNVTLIVYTQHGRPFDSSGWVGFRYALVVTWVAGLVQRLTAFTDIDEARTAAEQLAERGIAMSDKSAATDPVELARQVIDAGNRGELDAALTYFAVDAVWDTSRTTGERLEGAAAVLGHWEDWFRAYEELQVVVEELLKVGNDVVFTVIRQEARPTGTTGHVRQREGWVWQSVDGVFASVVAYPEAHIAEARAAAGRLAEERA